MIEGTLPQHTWTAPHVVDQHLDTAASPGSGAVSRSRVGPNSAASGTPTAPATCIAPESFDTHALAEAQDTHQRVEGRRPARSMTAARTSSGTSARTQLVVAASADDPISTHARRARASVLAATSAKCSAGHRLAPPYAAPGAMTTNGRTRPIPSRRADLRAALTSWRRDARAQARETVLDAKPLHQAAVVLRLMNAYRRARHRARQQHDPADPLRNPIALECLRS